MSTLRTYREGTMGNGHDVVGYDVEAIDGSIARSIPAPLRRTTLTWSSILAGGSLARSG